MEKWFCGLQFLEEGSQGPNMALLLHFYGFVNNIFGKNSLIFNKIPHTL